MNIDILAFWRGESLSLRRLLGAVFNLPPQSRVATEMRRREEEDPEGDQPADNSPIQFASAVELNAFVNRPRVTVTDSNGVPLEY